DRAASTCPRAASHWPSAYSTAGCPGRLDERGDSSSRAWEYLPRASADSARPSATWSRQASTPQAATHARAASPSPIAERCTTIAREREAAFRPLRTLMVTEPAVRSRRRPVSFEGDGSLKTTLFDAG